MRVSGNIAMASADISIGGRVVFLGDNAGSILTGGTGGSMLDFSSGTAAEIYDLTIKDSPAEGIIVSPSSTLLLVRSKITNPMREGILGQNQNLSTAKVSLLQSEVAGVRDAARRAISIAIGGELTMDRSRIVDNEGGGILLGNLSKFTVTNSFLVGNRTSAALVASSPQGSSKMEFSTIVDNVGPGGTQGYGGVFCDNSTNAVIRYNIIYRNTGGPAGAVQKVGDCNFSNNFELAAMATDTTLEFKSETAPKDYHLTAASPAMVKDIAGVVCTGLKDYDGEERPQGAACDYGADELKQ